MSLRTAPYLAPLLLVAVLCLVPKDIALGCAPAPRHGQSVQIASESAIIIWDAKSKTQHFIRRASFASEAKDFGFLVPTPAKPELAEASDEAFTNLAKLTEPKVVKKPRPPSSGGGCGCGGAARKAAHEAAAPAGVAVLGEQRVGNYDTACLKADDADDLEKWLKGHNYEFSPELKEWVKPYIARKWVFTAFKIARDDSRKHKAIDDTAKSTPGDASAAPPNVVSTSAVRMSFSTDQPFFPYREPDVKRDGPGRRLLRIYFLGEDRVKGSLSDSGKEWNGTATEARVAWCNKVGEAEREKVLGLVKLTKDTPPGSWWLTEFEDLAGARPAEDVNFSHDDNQSPVERPPIIEYSATNWPDGAVYYAVAMCLILPRVARRWRRRTPA